MGNTHLSTQSQNTPSQHKNISLTMKSFTFIAIAIGMVCTSAQDTELAMGPCDTPCLENCDLNWICTCPGGIQCDDGSCVSDISECEEEEECSSSDACCGLEFNEPRISCGEKACCRACEGCFVNRFGETEDKCCGAFGGSCLSNISC